MTTRARARPRGPQVVVPGVLAAVAALVLGWRVWRPAYWYDESVTVMVGRRSVAQVLRIATGQEAPIGPYYLLVAPLVRLSVHLPHPEWLLRAPSVVAGVATVWLLVRHAALRLGPGTAAAAGSVLVALPVFSRYAQEARPYALACACATASALLAVRLRDDGRRRVGLAYVVSVVALGLLQVLALAVVVAHLVAALLPGPDRRRWGPRVSGWTAVSLAVLLPYLLRAQTHVLGVARPVSPAPGTWAATVGESVGTPAVAWTVLVLAAVGCARLAVPAPPGGRRPDPVVVHALVWALAPAVLLAIVAATGRPALVPRYALVALPGWALLAGSGCLVLGGWAARLAGGRRAAAVLVTALPVAALVVTGAPSQRYYRGPDGHGGTDPRPVLEWLREPARRRLPVVVQPARAQAFVRAYAPDVTRRMLLTVDPAPAGVLALPDLQGAAARRVLARHPGWLLVTFDPLPDAALLRLDPALRGHPLGPPTRIGGFTVRSMGGAAQTR